MLPAVRRLRRSSARAKAPLTIVASTLVVGLTAQQCAPNMLEAFITPSSGSQSLSKISEAANAAAPAIKDRAGSDEGASTANLAKTIIGAAVLALPHTTEGVVAKAEAAGFDHDSVVVLVAALFLIFAALNASGFYLIGYVCEKTGAKSFQEAWTKTLGAPTAWLPSVASIICCLTATVVCATVIGDIATEFVTAVSGMHLTGLAQNGLLFGITGGVLLPLCLLPSLSPLAFASVLGLGGVTLLAAIMIFRCVDGSYMPGAEFADQTASITSAEQAIENFTGATGNVEPMKRVVGSTLLFAAVLANCLSAHYNAPALYSELQAPEIRDQDLEVPALRERRTSDAKLASWKQVTVQAFGFAGVLFMVVAVAGLETFGPSTRPLVLDNYAHSDWLVAVARFGLGLCVLGEFPLLERCTRTNVAELVGRSDMAFNPAVVAFSVFLPPAIACVPGLEFDTFTAIGGAAGASFLTYVAPALMALQLRGDGTEASDEVARDTSFGSVARKEAKRAAEVLILRGLAVFGVVLGGLGVAQASGLGV